MSIFDRFKVSEEDRKLLFQIWNSKDPDTLFAMGVAELWEKSLRKKYGVRRSKREDQCMLSVAGKHDKCAHFPESDHSKLWIRDGKPFLYTTEPYGWGSIESCEEAARLCREHGLTFRIGAHSPHYPGGTVLVEVTRDESEKGFMNRVRAKSLGIVQ